MDAGWTSSYSSVFHGDCHAGPPDSTTSGLTKGQPARGGRRCHDGTGNGDENSYRRRRRPDNHTHHHHPQPDNERDTSKPLPERSAPPDIIETHPGANCGSVAIKVRSMAASTRCSSLVSAITHSSRPLTAPPNCPAGGRGQLLPLLIVNLPFRHSTPQAEIPQKTPTDGTAAFRCGEPAAWASESSHCAEKHQPAAAAIDTDVDALTVHRRTVRVSDVLCRTRRRRSGPDVGQASMCAGFVVGWVDVVGIGVATPKPATRR